MQHLVLRLKKNLNNRPVGARLGFLVFFLVFIDQFLKILIKSKMVVGDSFEPIPGFDKFLIYFVENNGFAFGYEFFGSWGKLLLSFLRIILVVIIFNWIVRLIHRKTDFLDKLKNNAQEMIIE